MNAPGKVFLSGNEALARGAVEAGVTFASGYPGTPSTEILENLAREEAIDSHWATNEKVAFEEAMAVGIAGRRALVTMKHVGLNVAADAFMVFPYSGTNGGFVVVSADDPGMHSSQNEQDNRYLARMAKVPVVEPSDPQECKDFMVQAFALSETFGTPVMLRTTTRTAHCKGIVTLALPQPARTVPFDLDPQRFSVPIYRQRLRPILEDRLQRLQKFAEEAPFNRFAPPRGRFGVVASGISRHYIREVMPSADVVDLGMTHPLPLQRLVEWSRQHDIVFVVEEGDPFVEEQLRSAGATNVVGKDLFGTIGEYSPERLRAALQRHPGAAAELAQGPRGSRRQETAPAAAEPATDLPLPPRPPMFCVGCGHRTVFDVLSQLRVKVVGDIGCYTMGALPPYEAEHTTFCMGASIGMAIGFHRAGLARSVAVIGDSTFLHGGIPGLLDAVYTATPITVLILDNSTTGMTGQQSNAGSGTTISGAPAPKVDLAALVSGLGVAHVTVVDTWDRRAVRKAVMGAMAHEGPAVVIAQGPCQLLPEMRGRDIVPLHVVEDLCTLCDACFRAFCPAITEGVAGVPLIDATQCVACDACVAFCAPGAIQPVPSDIPMLAPTGRGS